MVMDFGENDTPGAVGVTTYVPGQGKTHRYNSSPPGEVS